MEEAKAMAVAQQQHHQQQQLMQQHHQQHHQQQQFLQLQQQQQKQLQHHQQQQQAMSRFPSNIDAHLRPSSLNRPLTNLQNQQLNPSLNPQLQNQQQNPSLNSQQQQQLQLQNQQQQRGVRPGNQLELQMAYQDAWRVCHPDFKRPFSSLEDACERLLPYHVVADYEAEEDDRILDSDTTGQIQSRSQQWDHNIAAKVSEFLNTFEKQAMAFNIISQKRASGEFRCEERLMIEQALLQEEKRAMLELRTEIESREKAQEAKMRMAAMVQADQARARAPIRANALSSQGSDRMVEQEHGVNQDDMINGWESNVQRDEKEPSEDFLNDEETENEDAGMDDEWHDAGEFDLNTR